MDSKSTRQVASFQVVLPVWNESSRILKVLEHLCEKCSNILVVDNFSSDNTLAIVHEHFPSLKTIQIPNNGTTETPEWWIRAVPHFELPYIYFASCSEQATPELFDYISKFSESSLGDLLEVQRLSITAGISTDYLYCTPSSILSNKPTLPTVIRLVRWEAIDASLIFPHSSFKNQSKCTRVCVASSIKSLCIYHIRPAPSRKTMIKHTSYAYNYALTRLNCNIVHALSDSSLRILLDTLRLCKAAFSKQLNRMLITEYLLRIVMHFQVVGFSVFCFLRKR